MSFTSMGVILWLGMMLNPELVGFYYTPVGWKRLAASGVLWVLGSVLWVPGSMLWVPGRFFCLSISDTQYSIIDQ